MDGDVLIWLKVGRELVELELELEVTTVEDTGTVGGTEDVGDTAIVVGKAVGGMFGRIFGGAFGGLLGEGCILASIRPSFRSRFSGAEKTLASTSSRVAEFLEI